MNNSDIKMLPLPTRLNRWSKAELIREVEQLCDISNRILESQAKQKLFDLDREIHLKSLRSHILTLEDRIEQLQKKLEKQAIQHKQAASDFPSAIAGHC